MDVIISSGQMIRISYLRRLLEWLFPPHFTNRVFRWTLTVQSHELRHYQNHLCWEKDQA